MELKLNLILWTTLLSTFELATSSIFAYSDAIPVILNPINAEQIAFMHPKMLPLQHSRSTDSPSTAQNNPTNPSTKTPKQRRSLAASSVEGSSSRRSKHLMLTKPFWPWP
ncbi:unnamed protein product [Bursaphelenchus xylophilus]|uniref:(pine wood nematode) hypothetical protein n=1 Tax=Bursaphelenchus xylophilus TaxID=6326 RepID=A0A1I7SQF9_BURXY|nr:unnamed protein product [Bursaphelenchus xylophilus]CAG9109841.1 unnamed protein product [Bursaphelenchus xylophilus]